MSAAITPGTGHSEGKDFGRGLAKNSLARTAKASGVGALLQERGGEELRGEAVTMYSFVGYPKLVIP